jgi:hypothetical protein
MVYADNLCAGGSHHEAHARSVWLGAELNTLCFEMDRRGLFEGNCSASCTFSSQPASPTSPCRPFGSFLHALILSPRLPGRWVGQ